MDRSFNFGFFGFLICRMQIFTIKVFWFGFVCVWVTLYHTRSEWSIYENHIRTHISLNWFCCVFFFSVFLFSRSHFFPSDLITVYTGFNWLRVYADGFFIIDFKNSTASSGLFMVLFLKNGPITNVLPLVILVGAFTIPVLHVIHIHTHTWL